MIDSDAPRPALASLRRIQITWLPLLLVALDILLVALSFLLVLVVLPLLFLALLLATSLRFALRTLSGGRLFARRRSSEPHPLPMTDMAGLPEARRRELAERYRPYLVLFPEDQDLGPPYQIGEGAHLAGADYHPRAVEIFLNHVRLRQGGTQWLPDLPDTTPPEQIRAKLGTPGEWDSCLEIPWVHGGNPLRIVRHLFPFGRQFRAHWALPVPKADCGCAQTIWERYLRIVKHDVARPPTEQRYPHTLYARVLAGRELPEIGEGHPLAEAIAVQYWWFFFYNDAWNRHQGDWENLTVFLQPCPDGLEPFGAAYASHDLGRWRRWQDVGRVDDAGDEGPGGTHPVVYVARGSHASYFDYNEHGYHPEMTRRLRLPFFGDYAVPSQFAFEGRRTTDWVADNCSGFSNGLALLIERVCVMPPETHLRDLAALRADDAWWWLAYRGRWGTPEFLPFFGGSGPRGPQWQGAKWNNPFRWVMRECMADDLPYWLEMFARWDREDKPPSPGPEDAEQPRLLQPQEAPV